MRILSLLLFLIIVTPAWADQCALVDGQNAILRTQTFEGTGCPADPKGKSWRWLPAPAASVPAYDPTTQVISGPTRTVGASSVTETYTVRDKTAQELSDAKDQTISGMPADLVLKILCDHESRIRVLEGKSAVTLDQCRAAIKSKL